MALASVATKEPHPRLPRSDHDLWLSSGQRCLTVILDAEHSGAPPEPEQLKSIHGTITGLAKAVEIIANLLQDGETDGNEWDVGLALNGLADAIVLHTTLAEGIHNNLHPDDPVRKMAQSGGGGGNSYHFHSFDSHGIFDYARRRPADFAAAMKLVAARGHL